MSTYNELFLNAMQNNDGQDNEDQSVISGKIIAKKSNEYFISSNGKSEMLLPFTETVGEFNVGDVVDVIFSGVKDGIPQASQKKAIILKAKEDIYQAAQDQTPVNAKIEKLITNKEGQNCGFSVSINGVEAFLPLSHIRAGDNPSSLIGQEITVAIIKHERNRLVVSEKVIREVQQKENFEQFTQKHQVNSIVPAIVDTVNEKFALVLIDGVRAFMPVVEFDWKYTNSLNDVLKKGDSINVKILEIDAAKKSIRVSRKATVPNPLDVFFSQNTVGNNLPAKVTRFARGLAIVEADCGTELLLPVGEMSWTHKVSDPKRLLNIGDRINVKIKEMNESNRKIIVSLRDMLENPWNSAHEKYTRGSKHHGTLTSITDFGIFVAFDDGIQGLIRKEDIDWENPNVNLQETFKQGESITAVVIHIDPSQEKLRLGIKQLSKNPYQNFADNYQVGSLVKGKVTNILSDKVEVEVEGNLIAFIHISQLSTERVEKIDSVLSVGDQIEAALRRINVAQQSIELSLKDMTQAAEKKEIQQFMQTKEVEIPTLGSMFGNILKKK